MVHRVPDAERGTRMTSPVFRSGALIIVAATWVHVLTLKYSHFLCISVAIYGVGDVYDSKMVPFCSPMMPRVNIDRPRYTESGRAWIQ